MGGGYKVLSLSDSSKIEKSNLTTCCCLLTFTRSMFFDIDIPVYEKIHPNFSPKLKLFVNNFLVLSTTNTRSTKECKKLQIIFK